MNTSLATRENGAEIIEQVMMVGDLGRLTAEQRVIYYMDLCRSLGLNPMSKPFDYMNLKGKLVLYAKKDCAEQLRKRDNVSIIKLDTELSEGVYIVTAYARNGEGRQDTDVGVVSIENLRGEDKSNAMMKAITKAKRRVTLSICGLGFLDETEIDSIPDARPVRVDIETGVIEGETRPVETKSQPTQPTRADLVAQWTGLVDKAYNLEIPVKFEVIPDDWPLDKVGRIVGALAAKVREEEMRVAPDSVAA